MNCDFARTQIEMTACAERAWKAADDRLNKIWPEVRSFAQQLDVDLPAAQRGIWQAMLDGQRAWLTFRDKSCEAEGGLMRGGSAEPMVIYSCRHRLTLERVAALEGFLDALR